MSKETFTVCHSRVSVMLEEVKVNVRNNLMYPMLILQAGTI